jgi:hypothetical protein
VRDTKEPLSVCSKASTISGIPTYDLTIIAMSMISYYAICYHEYQENLVVYPSSDPLIRTSSVFEIESVSVIARHMVTTRVLWPKSSNLYESYAM